MDKETAELIVDKIINDLNGRRGCGIDSLDDEIQSEIKSSWVHIAMNTKAPKKQEIKVIETKTKEKGWFEEWAEKFEE